MMTIVILWYQRVKLVCMVPCMIVIETAVLRVPLLECEVVDFSKFFGCKHKKVRCRAEKERLLLEH
jgi:hypothetical protein